MPQRNGFSLTQYGITLGRQRIRRNLNVAELVEHGILFDGSKLAASGALVARSGEKTGRSPKDKRVVAHADSEHNVWWGDVNIKLSEGSFDRLTDSAVRFLNQADRVYVVDGYAGWGAGTIKIRTIAVRPYHALFMRNMMRRPSFEELESYGEPDFVIINAGQEAAEEELPDVGSTTCVALSLERMMMVILGTEYAGEMKKGVFTAMNYRLPMQGMLSMHCSCNVGDDGTSLFFGLSGTGKTTLSADPRRRLVGDDEHYWHDGGISCIEAGCYAKGEYLSPEQEPEIFHAIRWGALMENGLFHQGTREIDYSNLSITPNIRVSYPIEYISNALIPCVADHPKNIFLLTCDCFGIMPPVAKLTPAQAAYHFLSGYTSVAPGTVVGAKDPKPKFSAAFGDDFLVLHPTKHSDMLVERLEKHGSDVWLVNTGWSGGPYGEGHRMDIAHSRAILDAVHDGKLEQVELSPDPVFGFGVPQTCPGVPSDVLHPRNTWADKAAYDAQAKKLAEMFRSNFAKYADRAAPEVRAAGPPEV